MNTIEIVIDGMHCDACLRRATDAIKKVPGATPEKVALGSALVQLAAPATPQSVIAALEQLGFDAHVKN